MKLGDQANDLAGCYGCYDGTFRRKRQRILNKIGMPKKAVWNSKASTNAEISSARKFQTPFFGKGGKTSKRGCPLMPDRLARAV